MYKIVRMYYPDFRNKNQWGEPTHRPSRTIKTGLTLEEAQAHCSDPKTREGRGLFRWLRRDVTL